MDFDFVLSWFHRCLRCSLERFICYNQTVPVYTISECDLRTPAPTHEATSTGTYMKYLVITVVVFTVIALILLSLITHYSRYQIRSDGGAPSSEVGQNANNGSELISSTHSLPARL